MPASGDPLRWLPTMLHRKSYSFGALSYATLDDARQAISVLEQLEQEHELDLKDAAIVTKEEDGKIELEQSTELSAGSGALAGGVIGLMLGLALGGPVAGVVVGAATGGVAGLFDSGIANKRLDKLGQALEPGQAAVGVLIDHANWALLQERLAPLGGHILERELTDEAVDGLTGHVAESANDPASAPDS